MPKFNIEKSFIGITKLDGVEAFMTKKHKNHIL